MITRQLGPDDWLANREIRLEALADSPGNFFTTLAEAQARTDAQWRAMLADPDMAIFGLFDGAHLAGLTAIYIDRGVDAEGRAAGLAMSYIRPPWRGRGLTAQLYAARLAWARERGVARIGVSHRASNAPSRRAIERQGFRRIGADPYDWPDGTTEDNVRYELRL